MAYNGADVEREWSEGSLGYAPLIRNRLLLGLPQLNRNTLGNVLDQIGIETTKLHGEILYPNARLQ